MTYKSSFERTEIDSQGLRTVLKIVSIYGLVDPRDGLIRYVGQTIGNWSSRLSAHATKTLIGGDRGELQTWIKSLPKRPRVRLLQQLVVKHPIDERWSAHHRPAFLAETRHIRKLLADGHPLLNVVTLDRETTRALKKTRRGG